MNLPAPIGEPAEFVRARREGHWEHVNGGWLADCATAFCRNAKLVARGEMYVCDGAGGCGRRYPIAWPTEEDQAAIGAILALRPDPVTRNWFPHESTLDLLMENLANGVPAVSYPEIGAASSRLVLDVSSGAVRVRVSDRPVVIDAAPDFPAITSGTS